MGEFYFALMNEDGTYGKLQKLEGAAHIEPLTESPDQTAINYFSGFDCSGSVIVTGETSQYIENLILMIRCYVCISQQKSCFTCRKCKEMYRYPGFVTAEECVCTDGLECDTHSDTIRNCPNYEHRPYGEPMLRNSDLDKYTYVIRGKEGDTPCAE